MIMFRVAVFGALSWVVSTAAFAVPTTSYFENGDYVYRDACGLKRCDVAVAEARNGDNGTRRGRREWGVANKANNRPIDKVSVENSDGFWMGDDKAFSLTYDADGDVLSFWIDSGGLVADETVSMSADLSGVDSLYIRARGAVGGAPTTLTGMTLSGMVLPDVVAKWRADYFVITDFDWNTDWTLQGMISMFGDADGLGAFPSVFFRLVSSVEELARDDQLQEVSAPAGLAFFGLGLIAAGLANRRKLAVA